METGSYRASLEGAFEHFSNAYLKNGEKDQEILNTLLNAEVQRWLRNAEGHFPAIP